MDERYQFPTITIDASAAIEAYERVGLSTAHLIATWRERLFRVAWHLTDPDKRHRLEEIVGSSSEVWWSMPLVVTRSIDPGTIVIQAWPPAVACSLHDMPTTLDIEAAQARIQARIDLLDAADPWDGVATGTPHEAPGDARPPPGAAV